MFAECELVELDELEHVVDDGGPSAPLPGVAAISGPVGASVADISNVVGYVSGYG